jgi:hypothetical protein
MPKLDISLEDEQKAFEAGVATIEAQWNSPRQSHFKRPYNARTIAALRNYIPAAASSSSTTQALKLLKQLHEHKVNGTCELTFGTTDPAAVSHMAKYQQAVYVSGALCGFVCIPMEYLLVPFGGSLTRCFWGVSTCLGFAKPTRPTQPTITHLRKQKTHTNHSGCHGLCGLCGLLQKMA